MVRQDEPRSRRSDRNCAERTAQTLLTALLISTTAGCATYDTGAYRPAVAKSRPHSHSSSSDSVVVVRRGDTLHSIARTWGVSTSTLLQRNNLRDPDNLKPGQRLRIPTVPHRAEKNGGATFVAEPRSLEPIRLRPRAVAQESLNEDEAYDPRLAGARYYAFDGPRTKPYSDTDVGPADDRVREELFEERDLDAAYEPSKRGERKPVQIRSAGDFIWPVRGKIISSFGRRDGGFHNDGINIAAEPGSKVRAAESGVVVYAGNELAAYGNLLLIRHPSGYVTAYAHNRKLLVERNVRVKKGQAVALVGDTGNVDRPQLHFEIRRGEKAVDPKRYLPTATASR